ncbi:MAG: sigma-70 family RNA polymerase sigma factor [Planctomycetota bacterium]|nr:sigma-70 family RNA polymerase sigma factor [Planctomycetota bacterium]
MGTRDGELERRMEEARWVRALAARLVGEGAADDLAQDAWVVALERGPREERAWPAWFAKVLCNLAGERRRNEQARKARERASARHEATESPDVVERAEAARRLAGHVLALEEPYRSTLLARYFDGLDANEIARRTGTNASTVRTRLERGLRQLRERLELAEGEGWQFALVPLIDGANGAGSGALAAASVAKAGAVTVVGGMLGMSIASKVALSALVLGLGAWILWPQSVDDGVGPSGGAQQEERSAQAAQERPEVPREGSREFAETAIPAEKPSETEGIPSGSNDRFAEELAVEVAPGTIDGLVLRRGEPVSGGTVYFGRGYARGMPSEAGEELGALDDGALEARTVGTDGRFRIVGLDAGDYWLGVDTGAGVGAQFGVKLVEDKPSRRVVVELGGARVEGNVYDAEGQPVAGVELRVDLERHGHNFVRFATSAADGRYAIDELPGGSGWAAVHPTGQRNLSAETLFMQPLAELGGDEVRRLDFGTLAARIRWTGRVVDRTGAAIELDGSVGHKPEGDGAYSSTPVSSGRFELRLPSGPHALDLSLDVAGGAGPRFVQLGTHTVETADFERDLVLSGTTLRGQVPGFDAGRHGATVYVGLSRSASASHGFLPLAADGTFRFHGVEPGEWTLGVSSGQERLGELTLTVLEGDLALDLRIPLARRGRDPRARGFSRRRSCGSRRSS